MLADLIQKVAGMEKKDYDYRVYPSMASPEIQELDYKGRCKRQMVYHALDIPRDNTNDRMILSFDDSSWHEELTRDWVNKTTWNLRDEQFKIDCGFFGNGKIDGILTDLLGQDYLWEHKALNHFTFDQYNSGKQLPIDYIAQCCIYLTGLQSYIANLDQAILLIKNKNTAQYLEFLLNYDVEKDIVKILHRQNSIDQDKIDLNVSIVDILTRARDKFEFVEQKKIEKHLPLRDYSMDDWQCAYCNWKGHCWESYEEEFKDLKDNIELSQDIEERLSYYLELKTHLLEMKKEQDGIKDEVKAILLQHNAKQAKTERYTVDLALTKSERVDKDKIPPDILSQVLTSSLSERLNIKLRKEKK